MKIGIRMPSLKRSLSASLKGAMNRAVKKAIVPGYGEKGMGLANPKKAAYNGLYTMTTGSVVDALCNTSKHRPETSPKYNTAYGSVSSATVTSIDNDKTYRRIRERSTKIHGINDIRIINALIKILNFSEEYYRKRAGTSLYTYISDCINNKANNAKREFLKTECAICEYMVNQLQTERSIDDIFVDIQNRYGSE